MVIKTFGAWHCIPYTLSVGSTQCCTRHNIRSIRRTESNAAMVQGPLTPGGTCLLLVWCCCRQPSGLPSWDITVASQNEASAWLVCRGTWGSVCMQSPYQLSIVCRSQNEVTPWLSCIGTRTCVHMCAALNRDIPCLHYTVLPCAPDALSTTLAYG